MIKIRLVRLLSHAKKQIVLQVLWQWVSLLAQIVAVFFIADMVYRLLQNSVETKHILRLLSVLSAAALTRFLCERLATRASYLASRDVKGQLREKIYEKLLRLGASYTGQVSTAEVVQVCTEGVEQLETYFGKYLPQLFYSLLAPVTLFTVLSFVSLRASSILLLCVPLIPVSIIIIQKIAKQLLHRYWGMYTGLGDSFLENLQGLTTLKIYQADEEKAGEMDRQAQNFRKITMKVLTMQLNSTTVMDIIAYGGAAMGMIAAAVEFLSGRISLAGALTIVLLASEFFIPLRLLGSFFHIAMNGMAASDKIFKILDMPEPQDGNRTVENIHPDISISAMSFSYNPDREILRDIHMDIPAGRFVSLVGASGCGKSTLAGILSGRHRDFQGEITLGGIPLAEIQELQLMRRVVLIRHNSYLFKGTVADNLKMAKPNAAPSEMEAVLAKVNLLSFLNSQRGLETQLQTQGKNFSGGQCQRLALARALLTDAPVMIFDEATSNIDVESEALIMQVIHELAKTKTILLISHRLQNVIASSCIYMMEDGKIREQGTHNELMAQEGAYCRLYRSQQALEQVSQGEEAVL